MKLLIIGASGVLGSRLYNDAIKKKWNAMGTYCSYECHGLFYLDLKDAKSINKLFRFFEPETIVLAGGIIDVDLCEVRPKLAREVNIDGTLNIVKMAKKCAARLAYLSTDYVFDGEDGPYGEEDSVAPISVYGKSKLEAENIVRSGLKEPLIVRTAQLYGYEHRNRNFACKIILNMKKRKKVYAADDFFSTPTYSGSLSDIIIRLLEAGKKGIFHVAGTEFLNRYDYVSRISDVFSLDKSLIKRVKLKDLKLKAPRPKKGGLKVDRVSRELAVSLFDCKKGLSLFRDDIRHVKQN